MKEVTTAKRVNWAVTHVGLALLTYFWSVGGYAWALNGLKFAVWLVYVPFVALALFAPNEMKKEIRKNAPVVTPWITWLIDLGVAVCLAFDAMWFYASMAGIAGTVCFALKVGGDDDEDEKPDDPPRQPRPLGDFFFEEDLTDGILGKDRTDERKSKSPGPPSWHV